MNKTILVVLLVVMGFAAQAAWSQQPQSGAVTTTLTKYAADPAYVQFYMGHSGYANSATGHNGLQTDSFAVGEFLSVCFVDGGLLRAFRCKNLVKTIDCVVEITIPPCPAPIPGATGPQGLQGDTGPQGFQGFRGQQGPRGFSGPQGAAGINGINGRDGRDGTICIQLMPRYLSAPFSGERTLHPEYQTFIEPARNGWVDAIPGILGGWLSAGAIRPAYSNIQLNNGSSSTSGSTSSATGGQGGQGGRGGNATGGNANAFQIQGQTSDNTNTNVLRGGDQKTVVDTNTNVGIVNGNAQAQTGGLPPAQ